MCGVVGVAVGPRASRVSYAFSCSLARQYRNSKNMNQAIYTFLYVWGNPFLHVNKCIRLEQVPIGFYVVSRMFVYKDVSRYRFQYVSCDSC